MARREFSSNLKNLKFMQRAAPREEKINKQNETPELDGSLFSTTNARRRCIVIVEGDPNPGALRGRMSFQSFNPSIDKLNEEAASIHQSQESNMPNGNDSISQRSEESKGSSQENCSDPDLKKKQPFEDLQAPAPDSSKQVRTGKDASNRKSASPQNPICSINKPKKREKMNWNLLRPSKAKKKRS